MALIDVMIFLIIICLILQQSMNMEQNKMNKATSEWMSIVSKELDEIHEKIG